MRIKIKNLRADAIIGINEWERENKQPLFIDVEIKYESAKASGSDDISYALDYYAISQSIIDYTQHSQFNLLETLAERLLDIIFKYEEVESAKITIKKPQALEDFAEYASVIQRRKR